MVNRQRLSEARTSADAKGAVAMVVATQYPESDQVGGRGKKSFATKGFPMVSSGNLAKACTVYAFAPELVDLVIAGTKSLDAAYEVAVERRKKVSWRYIFPIKKEGVSPVLFQW